MTKATLQIAGVCLLLICAAGFIFWLSKDTHNPSAVPLVNSAPAAEPLLTYPGISTRRGNCVAVIRMGNGGQVWAGSAGQGVGTYDPASHAWKWFTTKDGLGDNFVYALATDHQGRTWVGHLNHGVSVYNGQAWKNYDATQGPLSQRIFAISICPIDGDVWMAGDCGLARYSIHDDRWSYFTPVDGLPSSPALAIAFDSDGNLYLGTGCDGVAISTRAGGYTDWRTTPGQLSMPLSASGDGLPSNLVNDLVVSPEGTVYAATIYGLGIGKDHGQSWSYVRGTNWQANANGLANKPAISESTTKPVLSEDRCTALALEAGRLLVGHWHSGVDILDCDTLPDAAARIGRLKIGAPVQSVQPIASAGIALIGTPKQGTTSQALPPGKFNSVNPPVAAEDSVAALPSPAGPPTVSEIEAMTKRALSWPRTDQAAEYLGEDWATRGDWIGRVGRNFGALFGVNGPADIFGDEGAYPILRATGSHVIDGAPRGYYYIGGEMKSDRSVLYDTKLALRFFGEWNDGSWQGKYTEAWEGPDLGVGIHVPAGVHRISLYFMSQDRANEPLRDYEVELKRSDTDDFIEAENAPTLARARVKDFWEGVYKEFIVRGEGQYWFKISRNGSHCVKASAIFVDNLDPKQSDTSLAWPTGYQSPSIQESAANSTPAVSKARELWASMDQAYDKRGGASAQRPYRLLAYRAALAAGADADLLTHWKWNLGIWSDQDHQDFDLAMKSMTKIDAP
jgi:hypothetical protein